MEPGVPRRTVIYNSDILDASRWDRFKPRQGDIFICAPPKSGTTWTQAICALLIFGRPDIDVQPGAISPWIDAKIFPLADMLAMLEAQTHQRFLKTHTPLDGMPYYAGCKYLAVYRDPRDVYFSARNHATNQVSEANIHRATADIGAGFRAWTDSAYRPGQPDNFSLQAIVHHYSSFRRFSELPTVHMTHYSDLLRDLPGGMARIAEFIGTDVADPLLGELAAVARFDNMKEKASQFVPGAGLGRWKDDARFFNKGSGGQWRGVLEKADLALYDAKIRQLLPDDDIAWLHDGDGAR